MVNKNKAVLVFLAIGLTWLLSYGIQLSETRDRFKIEKLDYEKVKMIKVTDRVLVPEKNLVFKNKDSIRYIVKMLKESKPVNFDSINFHSTMELFEVVLRTKDETINVTLSRTSFMHSSALHGIISSGDYEYQNDLLLDLLKIRFTNK